MGLIERIVEFLYGMFPEMVREVANEFIDKSDLEKRRKEMLSEVGSVYNYYLQKVKFSSLEDRLSAILVLHDIMKNAYRFRAYKVADKDDTGATGWVHNYIRAGLTCGVVYNFNIGGDIYGMSKSEYKRLIDGTFIDTLKWAEEVLDCDNFAIMFKGLCTYMTGKNVCGIATGGIFTDKYCNTRPIGYHAWNVLNVMGERNPDSEVKYKYDEYRIYFYEPQNDEWSSEGKFGWGDKDVWYKACCGFVTMW
jgi:hypothetical protein